MRSAEPGEIPAFHTASKTLTDSNAGDVDELSGDKMVGRNLRANRNHRILGHAEFCKLALGLNLLLAEIAAVGLAHIVRAARTRSELQRDIAVLVLGAVSDHLALREAQHRHWHMLTSIGEHPGHSKLLCDDTRTHC